MFPRHFEPVNDGHAGAGPPDVGPPQKFRYRRVVGTIVTIVLLAAAVTGAAIGLSTRTGSNTEEAEVLAENSAANGASQTLADSSATPALGEPAISDIQPSVDTQSNSDSQQLRESSIPEAPLPDVGNNAEVNEISSNQVQNLNLVQNTREDGSSSSDGDAEARSTAAPSVNEAVAKLLPSAVAIYVRADSSGEGEPYGSSGSGIVIDDSGLILSAAHVFTAEGNHVTTDDILIEFDNGFFADGTLLGYDSGVDIAVISFDPSGLNFQAADLADVSELMVGDQVIAIGAPFGFVNSVNVGYVSGINRTEFLSNDENLPAAVPTIQSDAPINPGNSGGMLANTDGEVLGVNVYIRTIGTSVEAGGGNVGLGFAVPIDIAMRAVNKIIAGEQFFYGSLGVVGQFILEAGAPGPSVVSVEPRLSADLAGIQPGDHIIRFEDKKVRTMSDLASFVQFHPPGEYASIVLLRDGLEVRVTATIGTSSKASLTTIIS